MFTCPMRVRGFWAEFVMLTLLAMYLLLGWVEDAADWRAWWRFLDKTWREARWEHRLRQRLWDEYGDAITLLLVEHLTDGGVALTLEVRD